jgi:hypothetical protein
MGVLPVIVTPTVVTEIVNVPPAATAVLVENVLANWACTPPVPATRLPSSTATAITAKSDVWRAFSPLPACRLSSLLCIGDLSESRSQ